MSADAPINATRVGISAIKAVVDRAQMLNNPKYDSLISFSQAARVEPLVLVDTDVLFVDELHDVMQSLQSMFAGYYLQAVALNSTIGNVKVMDTLDKFATSRDVGRAQGKLMSEATSRLTHMLAKESYQDRLPVHWEQSVAMESDGGSQGRQIDPDEAVKNAERAHKVWRMNREQEGAKRDDARRASDDKHNDRKREREQAQTEREDKAREDVNKAFDRPAGQTREFRDEYAHHYKQDQELARLEREQEERARVAASFGRDTVSEIKENSNLSVGKMLEVNLTHNGTTYTVPVSIRLIANTIPTAKLVHILSLADEETSSKERYHGWKSGRLAFWKDLVFCRDLIDAHRKNLMANGDALYMNILAKEKKNTLAALYSGNPSVAAASNMVVTSTNAVSELELSLGGQFDHFATRQKVFEKTSLMIVAVIDKEWSRVRFYHRGLPEATDVSFRDLKSASKSGPDVSDILRAYQVGHSPSL
ncbi:hypothetical protein AWB81_04242 [Caballeronia arationis]|nr:hypothetical protein AWB81_04242 [Caballeronia arationis]